jgi:hypothetical protein
VPIHGRDDWKWFTRSGPAEPRVVPPGPKLELELELELEPELGLEELELEDDPIKLPPDKVEPVEPVTCDACERVELAGAVAVVVTTGSGNAGATGSGTGGGGSETVTVGTGGMGIGSPVAVPATSPAPTRTASAAIAFISQQLATAAFGCAPSGRGHKIRGWPSSSATTTRC